MILSMNQLIWPSNTFQRSQTRSGWTLITLVCDLETATTSFVASPFLSFFPLPPSFGVAGIVLSPVTDQKPSINDPILLSTHTYLPRVCLFSTEHISVCNYICDYFFI